MLLTWYVAEPVRSTDDRTGDDAKGAESTGSVASTSEDFMELRQAMQRIEGELDRVLHIQSIADARLTMSSERQLNEVESQANQDEEETIDDMRMAIGTKGCVRSKVESWCVEKGYGFAKAGGEVAFVHVAAVRSGESLPIGQSVVMKVVHDHSKPGYEIKAAEAWAIEAWQS